MNINSSGHKSDLYNTLLQLSRNIFFYEKVKLNDTFESRIYLMFIHFSVILIIYKKKALKFDQKSYDSLFFNIENNLRELGFGDVTVNKKMKIFNQILYDFLLKIETSSKKEFNINEKLVFKYFDEFNHTRNDKYLNFEHYFSNFYDFCFELSPNNMIRDALKFKFNYGSS